MDNDFRNLFNNGDMGDEEFRREFMRIMNKRQKEMDDFLRSFYGSGNTFNPFGSQGRNPLNNPNDFFRNLERGAKDDLGDFERNGGKREDLYSLFQRMFGNNINESTDENGEWENKSWDSPDGSMSFYSASRKLNPEDLEDISRHFPNGKKSDPLETLKSKMKLAILNERYEEAAKYRDDIKKLTGEVEDNLSKLKRAVKDDDETSDKEDK